MAARVITVDVVSDTICPWCWVGKRRFEKGLAAVRKAVNSDVSVQLRWRPFFLDPTLPKAGIDKKTRYAEKFGAQRVAQMLPHMASIGKQEGINFSFGGKTANTTDSHRLMEKAFQLGGVELQNALNEELFRAYFENEGNPGDHDVLAAAAAAAGMDRDQALAFLATDELTKEVQQEVAEWQRKYRISGVPFFVIDGNLRVEGAQEPGVFEEALLQALGDR